MSETLIREIAEQILREEILLNWQFYLLVLAMMLIGTIASTFLASYIRKRAESYATKADLEQLILQLRATTEAAEEIKTAISHSDWSIREWKTLRRVKLEELVESVYAVRPWLKKEINACIFDDPMDSEENSPMWKIELISHLYFPELTGEINTLKQTYWIAAYGGFVFRKCCNLPELMSQSEK
ncbi:MAG: hypothetical protein CVU35_04970 [Betaproteobacteria bacterium HGW-Betaproteobacteria-8]|nr:MAG: hypothetical protein CVU35_04970 [Betaproteobacteria bacterium HGW-Betaproteobacteria-8]